MYSVKYTSATSRSPAMTSIFSSLLVVEASEKFADPEMIVGVSPEGTDEQDFRMQVVERAR